MAEENQNISHGYQPAAPTTNTTTTHEESETKEPAAAGGVLDYLRKKKEDYLPTAAPVTNDKSEVKSRGMFDFLTTKKEGEEENKEMAPEENQNNITSHGYQQPAAPVTTHEDESEIKDGGMLGFSGNRGIPGKQGNQGMLGTTHDDESEIKDGGMLGTTHDDESEIKDGGMLGFSGNRGIPGKQGKQGMVGTTHDDESEIKDRGMFDFLGKQKEGEEEEVVPTAAHQNDVNATELEQGHVSNDQCEPAEKKVVVHEVDKEDEEKHHSSLLEKLQRSDSKSSSSSDEEVEENGEKIRRKKKKGLKEKIHEKISGDHNTVEEPEKKNNYFQEDHTSVPIEKCDDVSPHSEEKKGLIEKIKGKLHKNPAEDQGITYPVVAPAAPAGHPVVIDHHEYASTTDAAAHRDGEEVKEKKGFLEKIKEKLPGHHKSEAHAEKKDTPTHY